ncbi:hypothetical protein D9757_010949 [Collybiopsis confluens]|uniref:G domain-containing protein n=1 Tax=Collybiopsis confluens TaxID=2823264 RepID=A0A8H5LQU7_9AGAR|nr:hypothetical protein D9757_010949 [Collybiopsis confluens]
MANYRNVLFFGPAGCGKSSVIEMLSDTTAPLHSSPTFSLFRVQEQRVKLEEAHYCFYEITVLSEGKVKGGECITHASVKQLSSFVQGLKDGLSLLVFCLRGQGITEAVKMIYDAFYDRICKRSIPIVLLVTGLENEEPMDSWWRDRNHMFFTKHKMLFQGHGFITATRGRPTGSGFANQDEYDTSRNIVRNLIANVAVPSGFHVPPGTTFDIVRRALTRTGNSGWPPILKKVFSGITARGSQRDERDRREVRAIAGQSSSTIANPPHPRVILRADFIERNQVDEIPSIGVLPRIHTETVPQVTPPPAFPDVKNELDMSKAIPGPLNLIVQSNVPSARDPGGTFGRRANPEADLGVQPPWQELACLPPPPIDPNTKIHRHGPPSGRPRRPGMP